MRKSLIALTVVGISSLLLAGCGGGGGGGTSGGTDSVIENFIRWSAIEPPATIEFDGQSVEASYASSGGTVTSVTSSAATSNSSATVSYNANGTIHTLTFTTPNSETTWDTADGAIFDETTSTLAFVDSASSPTAIGSAAAAPAYGWEYQTFGIWLTGFGTDSGRIGAISTGAPTIGSAIPTSGDPVTFTGVSRGFYVDATGNNTYVASGSLTVIADFTTRELAFNVDNSTATNLVTAEALSNADSILDMTGTLTYSAGTNAFSGSVTADGGMTGDSSGRFYGPNAEELGGVFDLTGTDQESYIGAYGGAQ